MFPQNIKRQRDSRRSCETIRLTASSPRRFRERTQTALSSGLCLNMCVRVTPSTSRVSATRKTSTPILRQESLCSPCSLHSLSLKESSSNSNSVRASRSLRRRESTQAESRLRSTGRGSVSSMGNGSPKVSQGVTLCGEWACTERIMVVPIDYGQVAHINIVP